MSKNIMKVKNEINDRIFELRQEELTYNEITRQLKKEGIEISLTTVRLICKKIYAEKNMEEPKVKKIEVSDEKIFELRQQELYYREIVEQLQKEGVKVSRDIIRQRCKRIYAEKNMEEPDLGRGRNKKEKHVKSRIDISKMDPEKILHIFNNIQHRKKATRAQLEELAAHYGIDYSKLKQKNEKIRY